MAEFQAYSCDALTGKIIDQIPVSAFTWSRMLSAQAEGSATIPLDGSLSKAALQDLLLHWSRILRLDRDGQTVYGGYVTGRSFQRGTSSVIAKLSDLWALFPRRGAWDHGAPNVELWKTTVVGSLAHQAAQALLRGRDSGPALPPMGIPVTVPGFGGTNVSRTYYGYFVETIEDVFTDLLDEGLDVYFQPRNINNGDFDWLMRAGNVWTSGADREFWVTSDDLVTSFSESDDAARVTNNARYIGEGSEVDMLIRSDRNVSSPYPLLDRSSEKKNISSAAQLSSLARQDLAAYREPTSQWSFKVTADTQVDIGDVARLWFHGDPWIADGRYDRRVVGISGDLSEQITVSVQPTGGA